MGPFGVIDIASICVKTRVKTIFGAESSRDFEALKVAGDARRLEHSKFFRLKITGLDPQLYLPALSELSEDESLAVNIRLCVRTKIR